MILIPSSRPDNTWTVLDQTGKSVSRENFTSREAAIEWITSNGHTAYDSQGSHVEQSQ